MSYYSTPEELQAYTQDVQAIPTESAWSQLLLSSYDPENLPDLTLIGDVISRTMNFTEEQAQRLNNQIRAFSVAMWYEIHVLGLSSGLKTGRTFKHKLKVVKTQDTPGFLFGPPDQCTVMTLHSVMLDIILKDRDDEPVPKEDLIGEILKLAQDVANGRTGRAQYLGEQYVRQHQAVITQRVIFGFLVSQGTDIRQAAQASADISGSTFQVRVHNSGEAGQWELFKPRKGKGIRA